MDFIEDITVLREKEGSEKIIRMGNRVMIDLCQVVKSYYYNPHTVGSNSIKAVLPAIFESSAKVIERYSKPIGQLDITSSNFNQDKIWIRKDENNKVIDPYKSLPKPHEDHDDSFTLIGEIEEINNGGAALTAYGRAQYTNMDEKEREAISNALLKYCELDTLAMVMIYEHFLEITND